MFDTFEAIDIQDRLRCIVNNDCLTLDEQFGKWMKLAHGLWNEALAEKQRKDAIPPSEVNNTLEQFYDRLYEIKNIMDTQFPGHGKIYILPADDQKWQLLAWIIYTEYEDKEKAYRAALPLKALRGNSEFKDINEFRENVEKKFEELY